MSTHLEVPVDGYDGAMLMKFQLNIAFIHIICKIIPALQTHHYGQVRWCSGAVVQHH